MKKVYFGGTLYSNNSQLVQVVFHLDKKVCGTGEYLWNEYKFPFNDYKDVVKGLNLIGKRVTMVIVANNVYYDTECSEHKKLTDEQAMRLWKEMHHEKSIYLKNNRWHTNLGDTPVKMPIDMCDSSCSEDKVLTLNLIVQDID